MAQSPDAPKDDGRIKLPRVDSAMLKVAPTSLSKGGKGAKGEDPADQPRRRKRNPDMNAGEPALSASVDNITDQLAYDPTPERVDELDAFEADKILARARKRFDKSLKAETENRKAALDDLKFLTGEGQWPADVAAQRNFDKRPCLTINKLPTFVHQITNDQRQNRPGITISPVGDRGDPEVARMYGGLIRAIERDSVADIAYDTAFFTAVSCGLGAWRVTTEYEGADSFDQVIRVKRIANPFTVYWDPDCQDPTGADGKFVFVSEMIPRDEFEDEWPDAQTINWASSGIGEPIKNWVEKDAIRVAEYFEVSSESRTLVGLDNGHVGWEDELGQETKKLISDGQVNIIRVRESMERKITWYKMTAVEILSMRDWPGKFLPVVKVIGEEINVEGKQKLSGIIRNAKQAQLMYNFFRPVSLDTPLPTPTGWTTMRDAKVGDQLLDDKGKPTTIIGVSPVHLHRDCYRVTFSDGTSIVADAEHPWMVQERGKRIPSNWSWSDKVVKTADLTPKKHYIEIAQPLDLPEAELPVHPYLLGAWLGDGTAVSGEITSGEHDIEEMRANIAELGYIVGQARRSSGRAPRFSIPGLRTKLVALGVFNNKHIPAQYLRASESQRRALLQGLMDTDGTIGNGNACAFVNTNERLVEGFQELISSLGIRANVVRKAAYMRKFPNGGTYECSSSTMLTFSAYAGDGVFRLTRKRERLDKPRVEHRRRTKRHAIKSVERVPSVPVKCVAIDSPSHLFLAGWSMVPTHNTLGVEITSLQPKAPWIMAEGQVEGHEAEWRQANTKNYPVLLYKPETIAGKPAPPPQRQPFAGAPAATNSEAALASQDLMATTGVRDVFNATMNERLIDESGRAIREHRQHNDLGSFHFVDNLGRSLRTTGDIFVDLIPHIYDTPRLATILREDDSEERVKIDPNAPQPFAKMRQGPTPEKPQGGVQKIYNPKYGQYGVTVTIGPTYATKRIEAAENMMAFAKAMPQTATLVADLIAKNMDWPGAEEFATRLAKAVPPNLLSPDVKDIPPQVQALLSAKDQQIQALMQERQKLMVAVNDKTADRAVMTDKINKDFEAKVLAIMQKADASEADPVDKFATFAKGLHTMMMAMEPKEEPKEPAHGGK